MTIQEILHWTGGVCHNKGIACDIRGISTDTRTLQPGEVFVALQGERYNGHDFILEAINKGALGIVLCYPVEVPKEISTILVEDTTDALKKIAKGYRQTLLGQVIVVVGSNGKTTCKDMLSGILQTKYRVTKTVANNNNRIGVSLTLLSAKKHDDYIVVEAGTSAPGEIAELCRIIDPDHALLTNIRAEHLERLRDIDGVFREECEIFGYLKNDSLVSLPRDDPFYDKIVSVVTCKTVSSGFSEDSDFMIGNWQTDSSGQQFTVTEKQTRESISVKLPLHGKHMAENACLSISLAKQLGVELAQAAEALRCFTPQKGRMNVLNCNNKTIIDDTYNANPAAMMAALDVLEMFPGKKVAVLGDMAELGIHSAELHQNVAQYVSRKNIHLVIAVGKDAKNYLKSNKPSHHFATTAEALTTITDLVLDADVILIKGSRKMQMDQIVEHLRNSTC